MRGKRYLIVWNLDGKADFTVCYMEGELLIRCGSSPARYVAEQMMSNYQADEYAVWSK